VLEKFADQIFIMVEGNHPHFRSAYVTFKGINFIYFLYQSHPVLPESPVDQLRFKDAGDFIIGIHR